MTDNTNAKLTSDVQKELMRIMNITWDDIRVNEQGVISNHQRNTRGERVAVANESRLFFVMGLVFSLTAVGIFILTHTMPSVDDDRFVGITLPIIFGLIGLSCLLGFYMIIRAVRLDFRGNRVEQVAGLAIVTITDDSAMLKVNDETFSAHREVLERIKHMEPYVIYYLPRTKNVMSIQHLSDINQHD